MTPPIEGTTAPGFEKVADAFRRAFDGKPEMGAALAVRHRGASVVDLWGGVADARTGAPWTTDTATVVFSCTKGLVSILAAELVRRGRLDYDALVTDYWPEFGQAGKAETRVGDLLAHRAGLSAPRVDVSASDLVDWDAMTGMLAAQEPLWQPGSGYTYHAITFGWLIGEVIRRVAGESVGSFFAEAVTGPLGADVWIGLPEAEQQRVALSRVGASLRELTEIQERDAPAGIDWSGRAMTLGGALPRELVADDAGFNLPAVRAAEIPGAGGIATARGLAAIWSATVTETDGVRLLDDATLDVALGVASEGAPVFDAPPPWPRWGMGFQLDSEARRYLTSSSFGHDGAGGQVAFADPEHGIGFAFVTNQMEAIEDHRATHIIDALRESLTN
ncbi:serine hydrolase domain-containing protein [Pseudolysinimonas sp.]|jgi:CubicO group peptidase (beta-lactamase class C family)|uniref:serine hydrolase domain-containing protein n=1 Tax=Pseudolysinimonas sp. TaxID=2680009 RepID=UPI003784B1FB